MTENEPILLQVVKCRPKSSGGQNGRVSSNFDLRTTESLSSVYFEIEARDKKQRDGIRFAIAQDSKRGVDEDVFSKLVHNEEKKMIGEKYEESLYIRNVRGATHPFVVSIFGTKK